MMYHLTLQTAGIAAGIFLVLLGLAGVVLPGPSRAFATYLPRSRAAGIILLSLAFVWSFWLLATMEMGEFSSFRKPLMFVLPVGYVLVLIFVGEFLAVRALGMLALLAAEPLLEAAFLRHEPSRLLVTVFAYIIIVKGLFWVTMPYLMRDHIAWSGRSTGRWMFLHAAVLFYGTAILFLAFTRY
ncbi:MAG: hypothetical protein ABIR71_02975 [Chthoniobacterales bacterium]